MRLLVLFLTGMLSLSLQAREQGDWIGRLSLDIQTSRADASDGSGVLASAKQVVLDDDYRLGYSLEYFVLDSVSIGLSTSWPFRHDLTLRQQGKLGDVRVYPATAMVRYSVPKWQRLQAWVGAGYYYGMTRSERLKPYGATLGSSMRLDDLAGLALEVGVDWDLRRHTSIGLRATRVDASADLSVRNQAGVGVGSLSLDAEPLTWSLNLSRRW